MHTNSSASNSGFIAKSVQSVASLEDIVSATIMDRSSFINGEFVQKVVNQSVFKWEGRKPRPALDAEGNFQATDLDLLSFLVPFVNRRAVIEIPQYTNRRQSVRKVTERRIGSNNFGSVTGLISNKDVFSFSIRIFDQTVVVQDLETENETTGAHRNYMLVDVDGDWYEGWKEIAWHPTAKENDFLNKRKLWSDNSVKFRYYVHPNRRQSIYGAPYLRLKMLSERLSDEASFFRSEIKRLEELGFSLPAGVKAPYIKTEKVGESENIKFDTIEMILDLPEFVGRYVPVSDSEAGLVEAYERQKYLTFTLKPLAQFVVRADEAAFFSYGVESNFVAPWMKGVEWETSYRLAKGRTDWNRLELTDQVALRYRVKSISQKVAA